MIYGIALGSNLGDRLGNLREAARRLHDANVQMIAVAPVYESEPVDCPDGSQNFNNTVIEVEAEIEPLELLKKMRAIEVALGRSEKREHHAPRTVDLDMLYAGGVVMQRDELTLPHPRMTLRRFVLQPLADIHPGLVLPGQGRTVAELLQTLVSAEPPLKLVANDWLE
ncbi:MAG: 2-amino-4-hydroxy-6-hydroxymethyldihydropteridine diphosphokinase [Verrucomicrobiaceae bacterium]